MKKSLLKRLVKYLKPYSLHIAIALIFTLISVLSSLYITVLIGLGVDKIVGALEVDFKALTGILIKIAILIIVVFISQYVEKAFANHISFYVARDIRIDALNSIANAPISYIDRNSHGEVISRIVTDVSEISNGLLMSVTGLFNGIITIIATLVFMLTLNVWISLLVVFLTPLSLLFAAYFARKSFSLFKAQSEIRGLLTANVEEAVTNQKVVKAFCKEGDKIEEFSALNEDLKKKSVKAVFVSAIVNPGTRFINILVYISVALLGAYLAVKRSDYFSVGALTACLLYANRYTKPFNEISGVITELQSAMASLRRVFELTDLPVEAEGEENFKDKKKTEGNVDLKDVSFSYDKDKELIKDLNLNVKKGMRVAIVGKTGSGKTTLINLLMRFYDVDGGEISIDGENINNLKKNDVRSSFGMVLQDPWLKEGTVAENIAYGKSDATREEIIEVAKSARIHNSIMRLKDGYDTVVRDGEGMSAGFKQLICVARVMLCLPEMLILDEATSSIDTMTERKVQSAFDKMMAGRTTFVVAHRLSTIKGADVILYIENGKVREQGSHEELLKKNGKYAELYKSQFTI